MQLSHGETISVNVPSNWGHHMSIQLLTASELQLSKRVCNNLHPQYEGNLRKKAFVKLLAIFNHLTIAFNLATI